MYNPICIHTMFIVLFLIGIAFLYDPKEKMREARWLNRFFLFGFIAFNGARWALLAIGIHAPWLIQ